MKLNLNFKLTKNIIGDSQDEYNFKKKEIKEACRIIKEQREKLGISRSELSFRTKISIAVIEALENNWNSKLPEETYLISMLNILEKEFGIKDGSLNGLLVNKDTSKSKKQIKVFTPSEINLFSTLQGSILYIFILFLSIILLNNLQKKIFELNRETTKPMLLKPAYVKDKNAL